MLKSSLLTVAAAGLFCLSLSFNANAADAGNWHNHNRTLGDWQQNPSQGIGELNQGMNQDQRCCPTPTHKPHSKYHEDQYKGGTIHHDHQNIQTLNTIVTTTREDVANRTEGTTDTEECEKKIEKKCVPCDK